MNGLYLIKPTSIASTGTGNSSSISANGSVTFSSCETLSLNGVFSADYDNYIIVARTVDALGGYNFYGRLRVAGVDATASNYTRQSLNINGTSITAGRSGDTAFRMKETGTLQNGMVVNIYGPFLAQPTALRTIVVDNTASASMYENANTHSLSTSYDGITLLSLNAVTFTGLVGVYGMVK